MTDILCWPQSVYQNILAIALFIYRFRLEDTLAVRKRFDPDELYFLLSKMSAAMRTIDKFLSTVEFITKAGQNSPYYLVEKSIHSLANITTSDIGLLLR